MQRQVSLCDDPGMRKLAKEKFRLFSVDRTEIFQYPVILKDPITYIEMKMRDETIF